MNFTSVMNIILLCFIVANVCLLQTNNFAVVYYQRRNQVGSSWSTGSLFVQIIWVRHALKLSGSCEMQNQEIHNIAMQRQMPLQHM